MHLNTKATLIDDIGGERHKTELKSSCNYSTNYIKLNHATSYLWPRGRTHTRIHTHILWQNESDYKKPGTRHLRPTHTYLA